MNISYSSPSIPSSCGFLVDLWEVGHLFVVTSFLASNLHRCTVPAKHLILVFRSGRRRPVVPDAPNLSVYLSHNHLQSQPKCLLSLLCCTNQTRPRWSCRPLRRMRALKSFNEFSAAIDDFRSQLDGLGLLAAQDAVSMSLINSAEFVVAFIAVGLHR